MPVDGIWKVDGKRIGECLEICKLRRDWLKRSKNRLRQVLKSTYFGVLSARTRIVLIRACDIVSILLKSTLKKWKAKYLNFTFMQYLP